MSTSVQDPNLEKIINRLRHDFKPLRLILYGSRAQGTHRADSDYDFVMVVPQFDKKNRYDVMDKIMSKFRHEQKIDVQVWIYSEADFNDWKDEFSSIPETALNTGKEIELG